MEDFTNKRFNALMREYELHRQELFLQIELYNRQTKYIQIFGAFLLGLLAFLSGTSPEREITLIGKGQIFNERSGEMVQISAIIILLFLILAAVILFYLVSTIMASSYMFLILRRRMALIEQKVNALLQSPGLLEYETRIAKNFLERKSYCDYHLTPHLLTNIWRFAIYILIIVILGWIAITLLPPKMGRLYFIAIGLIGLTQVFHYIVINLGKSKDAINELIVNSEASYKELRFRSILIFSIAFSILALILFFFFVRNV